MANKVNVVKIETTRDSYGIEDVACDDCMTAGELIRWLKENADDNARVVFSHDNDYTYGKLLEDNIRSVMISQR